MLGDQTSSANIFGSQAGEAWAAGFTGSTSIAVGIIDSGVDYMHADLYLNVWLNNGEIPASIRGLLADIDGDGGLTFRDLNSAANASFVTDLNGNGRIDAGDLLADSRWEDGIDQDANGFLDDLIGWDFANGDNDPYDDRGHGTHIAGTIAAIGGNGIGVAGVTWSTLLVPLKFLSAEGTGLTSNAAKALDYFTAASTASVSIDFVAVNASFGGGGYSQSMFDAIVRAARQDILFVTSAGNGGSDSVGDDTDITAHYPGGYDTTAAIGFDAVIAVAALTSTGMLASYSNYGLNSVELGAPGSSILSTIPGDAYDTKSGTSMAAPHVTGAIALFAGATGAGAAEIRAALLGATTATDSLAGKTSTGGRLDVMQLMSQVLPTTEPVTSIYGSAKSDTVTGTASADKIWGVPAGGTSLGRGTIDTLWGSGGKDIFVLGDERGLFYNDGKAREAGTADYARIMDFEVGDRIQLSGTAADYFTTALSIGGVQGTGIYFDSNDNGRFDSRDELIALVAGSQPIGSSDFLFVPNLSVL